MTITAPALPAHDRASRIYRIVELVGRYRVREIGKGFRLADMAKAGELLPNEYPTEDLAKQGALRQAAFDIEDLFAGGGR